MHCAVPVKVDCSSASAIVTKAVLTCVQLAAKIAEADLSCKSALRRVCIETSGPQPADSVQVSICLCLPAIQLVECDCGMCQAHTKLNVQCDHEVEDRLHVHLYQRST